MTCSFSRASTYTFPSQHSSYAFFFTIHFAPMGNLMCATTHCFRCWWENAHILALYTTLVHQTCGANPIFLASSLLFLFKHTVLCTQMPICALKPHHPISSASFNLKGCNLVCGNLWPNPVLTKNFSPIGAVVPEILPDMCWKTHFFQKVLKMPKIRGKVVITQKLFVRMSWNFVWN